jgi:hypothetical protein
MQENLSVVIASCLVKKIRENYLERTIACLRHELPGAEILVAFDKVGKDHLDGCQCYTHNCGLGGSFNWGLTHATHDIVLQMEDDWLLETGIAPQLYTWIRLVRQHSGIFSLMARDPAIWRPGTIQQAYEDRPYLILNKPRVPDHWPVPTEWNWNIYFYSNHPHLKQRRLHLDPDLLGPYIENQPPDRVEINMCHRYLNSIQPVFTVSKNVVRHIGDMTSRRP